MFSPYEHYTDDFTDQYLLRSITADLRRLKQEPHPSSKWQYLNSILYDHGILDYPRPTQVPGNLHFEAALLTLAEEALDDVGRSFLRLLGDRAWVNLHTITQGELLQEVDEQAIRTSARDCRRELRADERGEAGSDPVGELLGRLATHARRVDALEESTRALQDFYARYALYLLMEIARRVSEVVLHWEVKVLGQVVPGTGVLAVCERPVVEKCPGERDEEGRVDDERRDDGPVSEAETASVMREGRMGRLVNTVVAKIRWMKVRMRARRAGR